MIDALEARVGKPVVTSNQAMAWDALRLAGDAASLLADEVAPITLADALVEQGKANCWG